MRYAADHGYPVPEVHDVRANGSEIIIQRIDGPLMMEPMAKRPWTIPRYASMLADLHDQLHEIPAPDWLGQSSDGGDRLVHLDLHPLNVLLSAGGPVVIDWSNAAHGEALSDVALTYVLLTCPRMPGPRLLQIAAQPAREGLARLFARRYQGPGLTGTHRGCSRSQDARSAHDAGRDRKPASSGPPDATESATRSCAELTTRPEQSCPSPHARHAQVLQRLSGAPVAMALPRDCCRADGRRTRRLRPPRQGASPFRRIRLDHQR